MLAEPELLIDETDAATVRRQCQISPPKFLPSRAQIQAECRKIQLTWSPAEERSRRAIGRRIGWRVPGGHTGLTVVAREDVAAIR